LRIDIGRVAELAARQGGAVSRRQLRSLGVSSTTISRWIGAGRLHRIHPGVYAVGHPKLGIEGRLHAALLYAGGGASPAETTAALSHTTAAWWRRLIDREPKRIHVSVPGCRSSLPKVRVHDRRRFELTRHRGLPVTSIAQTLLDIAAVVRFDDLRRALAEADFRRLLDLDALDAVLARRQPGGAALRGGLLEHRPELAHTRSRAERRFLRLCERYDIPLPQLNVKVCGILVDAFWPEQHLVVEIDSFAAHGTPARIEADRAKELVLRCAGHRVQRYTGRQLKHEAPAIAADVLAGLGGEECRRKRRAGEKAAQEKAALTGSRPS
jgi:predicted transcriptional regulator of viral defense system